MQKLFSVYQLLRSAVAANKSAQVLRLADMTAHTFPSPPLQKYSHEFAKNDEISMKVLERDYIQM